MRITKGYVSEGLRFFKQKFFDRYGLTQIDNDTDPVIMFGVYFDADYRFIREHKGEIKIVWCGSDAMYIQNIEDLKKREHIVTSSFSAEDLKQKGLKFKLLPITPINSEFKPMPRGDYVYHYGKGKFYGQHLLYTIYTKTGIPIIHAEHNTYTKQELQQIYNNCFIGLRITPHDGVPTTGVELGLMGRRIVHNGIMPNAIHYTDIDSICDAIVKEYEIRHEDNTQIAKQMSDYINISDKWLHI